MKLTLKFQSSIGSKLFENVERWRDGSIFSSTNQKNKMTAGEGSCPSSSPSGNQVDGSPLVAYRNSSSAGQNGRLHDGTLDHEKVVFEDHCSLNLLGNYNNCCKEVLKVYRNGFEM